jgi:predicted RNA-binding protein with PUA-like domain
MQYWLMKSEPSVFSIDDLQKRPHQTEHWDGVRNYQVRNMIRDQMQVGDRAFFYHSSCDVPGIVGIIELVTRGYPDATAWDNTHKGYDPASTPESPRWYMVDVRFVEKFGRTITLNELREQAALVDMPLLRKGNRLSIIPVTPSQWQAILQIAKP